MTIVTDHKANGHRRLSGSRYAPGKQATVQPKPKPWANSRAFTFPQLSRPRLSWRLWRPLLVAAVILAVFGILIYTEHPILKLFSLVGQQEAVSAQLKAIGAWGPLALAIFHLVQVLVAVIPGHAFLIASGYVYGFPAGFLLNYLSIVAASQIAFSLARWAGRPLVSHLVPTYVLDRWYEISERQGFSFFIIAFLLPVFPTDAMNFVAGLSKLSGRRFLAANMLGRLPGIVLLTLIGSHGLRMSPTAWASMGLISVSLYVTGRYCVTKIDALYQRSAADPTAAAAD